MEIEKNPYDEYDDSQLCRVLEDSTGEVYVHIDDLQTAIYHTLYNNSDYDELEERDQLITEAVVDEIVKSINDLRTD